MSYRVVHGGSFISNKKKTVSTVPVPVPALKLEYRHHTFVLGVIVPVAIALLRPKVIFKPYHVLLTLLLPLFHDSLVLVL